MVNEWFKVHCVNLHAHCANHKNHFVMGHARYRPLCPIENFVLSYWVHSKFLTRACNTLHNTLYHPPQQPIPNIFHNTLMASSWRVWVLSSSLSSLWPASFGLFAYLDFGPCLLFSPFLGCSLIL